MIKNSFSKGETVVLFDMDGTLTPARKKLSKIMQSTLRVVSTQAKIGVVTGSPFNYVKQQLSDLWTSNFGIDPERLIIMPCNGTQVYEWNKSAREYSRTYFTDLKDFLSKEFKSTSVGKDAYTCIVKDILELQLDFLEKYSIADISGNFVSYRDSLVNWSMIGRDADQELRNKFEILDKDYSVREKLRETLRVRLDTSGFDAIDCVLGGATSIDIYPKGWDKTHCLKHFEQADVWFWGDRCGPNGNDRQLYEALGPCHRSFQVTDPADCARSVRENLIIDWQEADLLAGNTEIRRTTGSD